MLLSNGQALWAHCSTRLHWTERHFPFGEATLADEDLKVDFAHHTAPGDRIAVVATEPLTRDEPWRPMAPGQLLTFTHGAVHTGALAAG